MPRPIKFIDLFAGMGGTRLGFENGCLNKGKEPLCVFTSEIKESAIMTYKKNFDGDKIHGDITKINPQEIPDFDFLLAGFPCQPFSTAGKQMGFNDERGGLFFEIIKILNAKKPTGFILENVKGLSNHDNGKTIDRILKDLIGLGYALDWKVLNSVDFGIPQNRERVYITGHKTKKLTIQERKKQVAALKDIMEKGMPAEESNFGNILLGKFSIHDLVGKKITDKRGGDDNIHSWDLELKGRVTKKQKQLLEMLLKKRRMKKWAIDKGVAWSDGMPLTTREIKTFLNYPRLSCDLKELYKKGYLNYEYPKNKFKINGVWKKDYDMSQKKGYNIVAGKLSFPIARILDPSDVVPTIVATEVGRFALPAGRGLRRLSIREGLRLSGFPENYCLDTAYKEAFDLIGNTVAPPIVEHLTENIV